MDYGDCPANVAPFDRNDIAAPGRGESTDTLFAQLYDELHRMAKRELWRGGRDVAGPNTLVHEAWLQLGARPLHFDDRARFLAYAARTMRGLVIDRVRARNARKRGFERVVPWFDGAEHEVHADHGIARIGDALDELEKLDSDLARVVDLKFFCGLTLAEVAAVQAVAERTVQRQWRRARLLLFNVMADG